MSSDDTNKNDGSTSSGSVQIFSEHKSTVPERRNCGSGGQQRTGMNAGGRNDNGEFYRREQTDDPLPKMFFIFICSCMIVGLSVVSFACTSDSQSHCVGDGGAVHLHFWGNLFTILLIVSFFIRFMFSRVRTFNAAFFSVFVTVLLGFLVLSSSKHPVVPALIEDLLAVILCYFHIYFSWFFVTDTADRSPDTSDFNSGDSDYAEGRHGTGSENPDMPIWDFFSVDALGAEMRTDLEYFAPFFELLGYFFRKSEMTDDMCRVFSDDFFERANFFRAQTEQAELLAAKGRNCSDSDIMSNPIFSGEFITGQRQISIMFYILASVLFYDETVSSSEDSLLSRLKNSMRICDAEYNAILNYVGFENSMSYDTSSGKWVSSEFREESFRSDRDKDENNNKTGSERKYTVDIDPVELKHAFQILRIGPEETDENVRRAYLRMISRYHPDRVHAMDLEPEEAEMMLEQYHQITAELNEAWVLIKTARSIN